MYKGYVYRWGYMYRGRRGGGTYIGGMYADHMINKINSDIVLILKSKDDCLNCNRFCNITHHKKYYSPQKSACLLCYTLG